MTKPSQTLSAEEFAAELIATFFGWAGTHAEVDQVTEGVVRYICSTAAVNGMPLDARHVNRAAVRTIVERLSTQERR